jgi:hypothetical protein
VLLTALGLAVLGTLLCWRRILPVHAWEALLVCSGLSALGAILRPRWFRGFYRLSTRVGFFLSQVVARIVLALLFVLVFTPLGWLRRLLGKDSLQLKRRGEVPTYWKECKQAGPLDRMF